MITFPSPKRLALAASLGLTLVAGAQPVFQLVQLNTAQPWQRLEFRVLGIPAVANPFDPDAIRVDGMFTLPSGQTATVPAYSRLILTIGAATITGPPIPTASPTAGRA